METIIIEGKTYAIPESILIRNGNCEDHYGQMFLGEVFIGRDDWERIETEGGDWMNESQCFEVYGEHYEVNADDVPMGLIGDAMFAWFSDYKGEDHEMHLLVEVK